MKDLYMVFDTETCNTPKVDGQLDTSCGQVYDFGLQIVDNEGYVYEEMSFVNEDVFFGLPQAMQEAYFADKIPQYLTDIRMGKRKIINTWQMYKVVRELAEKYNIKAFIAHNARFDVRVLNSTLRYQTKSKRRYFFPYDIPIWDTMTMANDTICKQSNYRKFCLDNGYMTNHKVPQVRKTAEILWRFLTQDNEFVESHTGLEDVQIEAQIFAECIRRHRRMERLAELDED
jgi:DNA polymerase III epsilon subunit-like protein